MEYLSGQFQMTFTNESYDRLGLISFFRFDDLANLGCIYYEASSNRKTTHFWKIYLWQIDLVTEYRVGPMHG